MVEWAGSSTHLCGAAFGGWRVHRPGASLVTFEQTGTSGPATLLRWDAGNGYYLMRRAPK